MNSFFLKVTNQSIEKKINIPERMIHFQKSWGSFLFSPHHQKFWK